MNSSDLCLPSTFLLEITSIMRRKEGVHAAAPATAGVEHDVGEVQHRVIRVLPGGGHIHLRAAPNAGLNAPEACRHPTYAEVHGRGQRRSVRLVRGRH